MGADDAASGSDLNQKMLRLPNVVFTALEAVATSGGESGNEPTSQNRYMADLLTKGVVENLKSPAVVANMRTAGFTLSTPARLTTSVWPNSVADLIEFVQWLRGIGCNDAADVFAEGVRLGNPAEASKYPELSELAESPAPPVPPTPPQPSRGQRGR